MAIEGKFEEPIKLYDGAIKAASENGFTQLEAIANERAANFFEKHGYTKACRPYFKSAWDLFSYLGRTCCM